MRIESEETQTVRNSCFFKLYHLAEQTKNLRTIFQNPFNELENTTASQLKEELVDGINNIIKELQDISKIGTKIITDLKNW